MIDEVQEVCQKAWEAPEYVNWILLGVGLLASLVLILYIWRFLRRSNPAGRVSEFDEKAFKKIIEEGEGEEQLPLCPDCKMPMRVEIHYKGFMKDHGEFLIRKKDAAQTLELLVKSQRISEEDKERILVFFAENQTIEQQLFKRYKCANCLKAQVLPYKSPSSQTIDEQ